MKLNNPGFIRWPQSFLGPPPGLKELNVLCWGLFVIGLIIPVAIVLVVRWKTGAHFSDILPIDFIYFYGIGQLLNQHPAISLYDYSIQLKIFNGIYPLSANHQVWGRSPYPPFVAKFFSLFAHYSFERAYFLWMGTSFVLYITGIAAVVKAALRKDVLRCSLVFCFAIASPLFLYFNLVVGQLSTVATFSTGVAIYLERRSRLLLSGLALSILAYKPTLLLLIVPMLIVTRRFRTLVGFCIGAGSLLVASTLFAGPQIWPVYAHFLETFAGTAGIHGQSSVKRWEYVDFNSVSYAIPGARTTLGIAVLVCSLIGIGLWLVTLWRRSVKSDASGQNLIWALTLTWSLLINVYVPVYDTLLVVVAAALTIGALVRMEQLRIAGWVAVLAIAISIISFKTESIAEAHGIQLLTILILFLGIGQAMILQRAFDNNTLADRTIPPGVTEQPALSS